MVERLRAAEETAAEQQSAPAPVRPPIQSNRETADRLAAGPVGRDELAGLGGLAGNRAVTNWLAPDPGTPVSTPVAPSAGPVAPQAFGPAPPGTTPGGPVLAGPTPGGPKPAGPAPGGPTQNGPKPVGPGPSGPTPAGPTTAGPGPAQGVPQKQPAAPQPAGTTTPAAKAGEPPPPIDWIESLPAHVKQQIDNFSDVQVAAADKGNKGLLDARARNRITFMRTMRWAMGNDDTVIQKHFQEIQPIDVGDGQQLWAHVSTRERLLAVKIELEAQGVPMPRTTVGLGMRGDHLSPKGLSRGWFTHAAGFAVDWRATATPKIKDPRLIALFEMVTGGRPDMKASVEGDKRIDLEIKMGAGTADAAESKKLLDSVESEYKRLEEASNKFKTALPAGTLDRLRELEQARFAVSTAQRKLSRLQMPKPKATPAQIETATNAVTAAEKHFAEVHAKIGPDLPKLFEPWTKQIDEKIAVLDQHFADANVDVEMLTSDFGFDERATRIAALRKADAAAAIKAGPDVGKLRQLHQDAVVVQARIDAAKAAGLTDPDLAKIEEAVGGVLRGVEPLEEALTGIVPKAKFDIKPAKVGSVKETLAALKAAADKLGPRFTDLAKRIVPAAAVFDQNEADVVTTREDVAVRRKFRDEKTAALGKKKIDTLIDEKFQLMTLKSLKDALLDNTGGFVFGAKLEVNDPSLDQLFGLMPESRGGFFTPDPAGGEKEAKAGEFSGQHGYGLLFIKSMVAHGFEPGMAWRGGSDPMHFELAEGRKFLTSAGGSPVEAGATLRAIESIIP
ncbi:hypothetical protein [Paractinoplanes toevensis]|uniref:Uncharacterized protein n=1 Tax=Paractinoplanes toevensis TaxID=571911 RepID=A0A919TC04_9ACTN|nr:hypothetical protein [Actinoplanes toevensis]GIM91645.1 hypothetical protein Ato02nite_034380 [Actinoplanes toevensis]